MANRKAKKLGRRTITRQGIKRPDDTKETLEDIRKRLKKQGQGEGQTVSRGRDVVLKRNSVRVAAGVFQWRQFGRNLIPSDDHILEMARAVHERGIPLTPILVFPVASEFYVVDGHHRLAAYDTALWKKGIPALIFEGTLEDAWREALKRNSKNKLPMTRSDKLNAAWIIVKNGDPRDSIEITMNLSGASKGTVNSMRSVWKALNDGKHGKRADLLPLSWPQARYKVDGQDDEKDVEDWREAEAEKIVAKLHRAKLIGALTKNVDITALVLEKLDDSLPAMLTAEWSAGQEAPFDPHATPGDDIEF